jgi:ribosomal protein S18 acetylase RimI-like enzyme
MEFKRLGDSQGELDDVVSFMVRLNREASHHVLYCDEDETALHRSLSEFSIPPEESFVIARENGTIKGVLGFDVDTRLGRAWAYGPFVEHVEQRQVAEALWETSVPLLPQEIAELELAFDVRNKGLERFAEAHSMTLYKDMPVLSLRSDDWAPVGPGDHTITEYRDEHFDTLEELHDACFPATFWTARAIVERLDPRKRLLIAEDDARLTGYLYAEVDVPTRQGGIEFLAVRPDRRRAGAGDALVQESLGWLFSVPEVDEVSVMVDEDNSGARRLFEGFGFRVIRHMRAFRTPRSDP